MPPLVKQAFERSAESSVESLQKDEPHYHHQHYYIEKPSSTKTIVKKRKNIVYKPRVGEILVKDSVLYNGEAPATRHTDQPIRRNYWPLVDNTVTSLASKAGTSEWNFNETNKLRTKIEILKNSRIAFCQRT